MFAGRRVVVVGHSDGRRSRRGTPPRRRQTLGTGIGAAVFPAIRPRRHVRISVVESYGGGVNIGRRVVVYDMAVLYVIVLTRLRYGFAEVVVMVLCRLARLTDNYNDKLILGETVNKGIKSCVEKKTSMGVLVFHFTSGLKTF